jgi:D-proline reductase (dithiol) PrdB
VCLVARHLEANGIATVIVGSAIDIVEHCGVARYLHVDFPLGNPCGKPGDRDMQLAIIRQAVDLYAAATRPRTTVRAPFEWSTDQSWRDRYARVDDSNREALRRKGELRRQQQLSAKSAGKTRAPMID